MKNEIRPMPKNGWIVVCPILKEWVIALDEDLLARVVDRQYREVEKMQDCSTHPAAAMQIYELGEKVSVVTAARIVRIVKES